jgi:2-amino-4-hydroxy-6-hydroxymethyldihydropteridine diphosphokinase
MATAYINIGSNQGDRKANIERAVALIEHWADASALRSDYVESEPWGFQSDSHFLNLGISLTVTLDPESLLDGLLAIEHDISPLSHRNDAGGYVDRLIDIDLIAVDDIVWHSDKLTLPHPAMHLREFVLLPMAQIAPQWCHPLNGKTAGQLLADLTHKQ